MPQQIAIANANRALKRKAADSGSRTKAPFTVPAAPSTATAHSGGLARGSTTSGTAAGATAAGPKEGSEDKEGGPGQEKEDSVEGWANDLAGLV
jgi:hypothetical protein